MDAEVVDTHYHMFQVDSAYCRALSGRVVGQELLMEMTAGRRMNRDSMVHGQIADFNALQYNLTYMDVNL